MEIKMQDIIYICYDVKLNTKPLEGYMGVTYPHVTLVFKPTHKEYVDIITNNPLTVNFKVVGYGVNTTNEAIAVSRPMNCHNRVPHVTISHKGKPVESNYLDFKQLAGSILTERNINAELTGVLTVVTNSGRYAVKDIISKL